jgi:adenylyl-sulfate kinase
MERFFLIDRTGTNLYPFEDDEVFSQRKALKGHGPVVLWFTGLSGSGKTTIARHLEKKLSTLKVHSMTLDGDNVRSGLNNDLGFSDSDRVENLRRVTEVASLMYDGGLVTIVSFISPFKSDREKARLHFQGKSFIEVYFSASLDTCEGRDPKGLYAKARAGQIKNFTGIDSRYEIPDSSEIVIDTGIFSIGQAVEEICHFLTLYRYI